MPRFLFLVTGWLMTGLGAIGALLPLIPTTPFLIVAVYCFSRSSPEMHGRLLRAPLFGKYLRQWDQTHTVPRIAKWKAWFVLVLTIGMSIFWIPILWIRIGLGALGVAVAVVIWRLPESEDLPPID